MFSEEFRRKMIVALTIIGSVSIIFILPYFKLDFFTFFGCFTIFVAIYFLFYLFVFNKGTENEKILWLLLTIISTFVLLDINFDERVTIAIMVAIMMPLALMSMKDVDSKTDGKNGWMEYHKYMAKPMVILVVTMGVMVMIGTPISYSLSILIIYIISVILMINSIKKFK